jgi:uncharacterized membrane protein YcaP (DUF421 family)
VAGFVLFHRLLAVLAFRIPGLGQFVKGRQGIVITDGRPQNDALRRHYLSQSDLMADLPLRSVTDSAEVKEARLERSGDVSVVPRRP